MSLQLGNSSSDRKDRIIQQQLDVIRTLTANNLRSMSTDFWGPAAKAPQNTAAAQDPHEKETGGTPETKPPPAPVKPAKKSKRRRPCPKKILPP